MSHYPFKPLPSLTALRSFEAVARLGSAKTASEELHVTPTAISHQLKQLEQQLDVRLFERKTRQLCLTTAGIALYEAVHQGFETILTGVNRIKPRRRSLILSTIPNVATRVLIPFWHRLPEFLADVDVKLHISHQSVTLDGVEADAAIRYGHDQWENMQAIPLFLNRFVVALSPKWQVKTVEDLIQVPLLHMQWPEHVQPAITWQNWYQHAHLDERCLKWDTTQGLSFADETHLISAAIAGQGAALMSECVLAEELRSGALVTPFATALEGCHSYWVVPQSRQHEPELMALQQWVKAACEYLLAK